jgi:hypothetical protein
MLSLLRAGGYADSWCDGEVAGCTVKDNFPGDGTTSIMGWDNVWQMGSEYPEKEWSGEWWRGNELGYIINNPKFWSANGIDPLSILLGATPSQHAAVRPTLEKIFAKEVEMDNILRTTIQAFFASQRTISPNDVTVLVHQILYKHVFKRDVSWERAQDFVQLQATVVQLGIVSQAFPSMVSGIFLDQYSTKVGRYVAEFVALLDPLYARELEGENCAPSQNCTVQLASAVWDALYAAGGLSVPATINTALGVLFSKDESNPFKAATYKKEDALSFYWESIRYFPPVIGMPHWTTRPTCAGSTPEATAALNKPDGKTEPCLLSGNSIFTGYPAVNQFAGGVRVVPNLALAMQDPAKWGASASKFVLRNLSEYRSKSVAFAEMAVNNTVASGRMNRVCPGKELALEIGKVFFEEFDKDLWTSSESITFTRATPFVSSFTLHTKSTTTSRRLLR